MSDSPQHDEIDPLLLAAWLDRSLGAEDSARVEAALADDPALLDAMLAARAALSVPELPSKATLAAVTALIPAPPQESRPWSFRPATMAFAATVMLAVAVGGFGLGRGFEGLQNESAAARADQVLGGYFSFFGEGRR